ncbi:PREDICTED: serine/threonine-protein kinase prpf4B-like isoform X3 [Lupinus angustifolius]|uniref:serine/threonine-protein kinase prpf4B-like isoform X3 n=1 Tax=Lupinus angustifolius TaxID=3871 RepID=UPI00092F1157|nr:PREDICTED: serine/threonine-protein kinase prpf4B-like isoform X3 [Lupinus angustifolius]
MAHDSRRNHHRSSSPDNVDKSSKRHKHRHHSHRHHHSKKRDEKIENDVETYVVVPSPIPDRYNRLTNDDVEEGEILEEDDDVTRKHSESEAEPGEIEVIGDRDSRSDKKNLGLLTKNSKTRSEDIDSDNVISHEDNGSPNRSTTGPQDGKDARSRSDGAGNGYLDPKSSKGDNWQNRELGSLKGNEKLKDNYYDEAIGANGGKVNNRWNSSSESGEEKYKMAGNSPHDRYRSRSRSIGHNRERSRSQSIVDEHAHSKRRHSGEQGTHDYINRDKTDYDEERMKPCRKEHRHHSIDLVVDDRREYITKYHSREARDRDRSRDMGVDRDLGRENKRAERSRNREVDWLRRTEKERGRSKERGRRDVEEVQIREREKARDRRGEKDIERSWEAVYGRDRTRGNERDRSADRRRGGEREREWESERGDINREWYNIRERERQYDRYRHRSRDNANGKGKDLHHEDGNDNRDRYRKHSRYEETEYHQERKRNSDPVEAFKSTGRTMEEDECKKLERGEIEDDIDEDAFQLPEQEEDLNKIKEESRRRREAIMEKYRKQHQQVEQGIENEGKEPMDITEALDGKNDADDSETSFAVGKSPENSKVASEKIYGARGLGEGTPKSERSDDKFCDDIFGETPTGVRKSGKGDSLLIEKVGLHDNWDDAEGYYSYRFGEILDGRYEITAAHGKGVFSTVVQAKNLKTGNGEPEEVAIKIIRNNDTMYKAGMDESTILKKLVGADPDDKRHCVRFLSSFKYRNHLCLVFESLNMNLREVLKKFGRNIGLRLSAVRAYAKQLFIALKHLRNCGVIHCDIKPDNMLVNKAKNVLKLCDFGNAMFAGKNEVTPYLVSRFYRAPEIILGLLYDHPLDIWSVGCCLYEIYTGKVLFPGLTNNDMLRLHMELKGPFPKKMLRKGAFIEQHFDHDLNFLATEEDPVTQKTIKRMILNIKPKDIGTIISGSPGEDPKMLANFKDLLEKIFVLDPDKRLTVSQALNHPFITGGLSLV